MRRGEEQRDPSPGWKNPQVVLPEPGETRVVSPVSEIEQIDLVERIPLLALALENQLLAVGMKIAFAAALPFVDELAGIGEKARFRRGLVRGEERRAPKGEEERKN